MHLGGDDGIQKDLTIIQKQDKGMYLPTWFVSMRTA